MNTQHTLRAQPMEGPGHYQIIDDSCRQVAMVRHWPEANGFNSVKSRAATKAYADLFAASPALLEIAEAYRDELMACGMSDGPNYRRVCAAISQANGE